MLTACAVCFATGDAVVRDSVNMGIGVLLLVTLVVLAAFGRFIAVIARRSRDYAHLVDHAPAPRVRAFDGAGRTAAP